MAKRIPGKSESLLSMFIKDIPFALAIFDREMRYIYASDRWRSDYNLGDRQLEGVSHYEVFPEIPERWREAHRRGLAGESLRAEADRFERIDGSVQWARWELHPWLDSTGEVVGIVIFTEDITQTKLAEQHLRESEGKYRRLFENIDEGFCIIEMIFDDTGKPVDYRFLETNAAFENQTGLVNACGKTMRELAPQHEEHWFEVYGRIALSGQSERFENQASQLNRWHDVFAFRYGQPEQRQVAILFKDITARRQAKENLLIEKHEAEEASRAKSEFVANMSHEIRTPMTVFLSALDFLLTTETSPQQRKILLMADKAAKNLRNIIDDILDFSKIEARKFAIHKEPMDLRECVKDAVGMFALQAKERHVKLKVKIAKDIPAIIFSDPAAISQILVNLVGNALKFTDEGEIVVSASEGNGGVILAVEDTGPGIPEDKLGEIFNSFCQADASFKRKHGGSGLGLAICKGLVDLLGGDITVENREGGGAVFTFTMSLEQPETHIQNEKFPSTVNGATEGDPTVNILLVEDDPLIRGVISIALEERGWHVTVAVDGKEAVEIWRESHFDLVLMDIQLPQMNGLEVSQLIRREEGPDCYTPIIGFTAHVGTGMRKKCLEVGMNRVLSKPVRMEELYRSIDHCLATLH